MIERAIVDAGMRLRDSGEPYLLATAVAVHGSAYRRAGARLILARDHRVAGAISGGCLEGDLALRGWWRTRDARPVVVTYDSRVAEDADDDEVRAAFAVGCNGVVEVLLERVEPPSRRIDPLGFAARCVHDQRRGGLATIYRRGDGAAVGARLALAADGSVIADPEFPRELRGVVAVELAAALGADQAIHRTYGTGARTVAIMIEPVVPPPRLFVFGGGPDAVPVVSLARAIGWETIACVPRLRPLVRERFASFAELRCGSPVELAAQIDHADRAAVVIMAHDYELDRAHLAAVLATRASYIGALGPRRRTERMLADLELDGVADPRLHAPVGLELGAETPQEIALAIIGEIQAVIAGVPCRSLRDRIGAIHERPVSESLPDEPTGERIACAMTED